MSLDHFLKALRVSKCWQLGDISVFVPVLNNTVSRKLSTVIASGAAEPLTAGTEPRWDSYSNR